LHHTGGTGGNPLAKSSSLTFKEINESHRLRWPDFPSEFVKGSFVGYNFLIFPNGERVQTRALGEETAAQRGSILNTISVCLVGNFTRGVESPTTSQILRLKSLLYALLTRDYASFVIAPGASFDIAVDRVKPHRFFQNTECNGSGLPDSWGREIAVHTIEERISILRELVLLYQRLLDKLKVVPLGMEARGCIETDVRG
jgi:hypothetical protein